MAKKLAAVSPSHYSRFPIQPIEFIRKNRLDFLQANIIKYVCRHDAKNGLEDLMKARQYLDWLIEDNSPKAKPPRKRKPRVKVVVNTVVRAPTLGDLKDAFPSLSQASLEDALVKDAWAEMQRNPFKTFRATTRW